MSDIVERLRKWAISRDSVPASDLMDEAADEIARLRLTDENERSVASTGSAGEPVAWAALREDGDIAWIGYTPEGAADGAGGRQIIPLYRQPQPTLTDAEREAISSAAYLCEATAGLAHEGANATAWSTCAATLRALLERLK